MRKKQCFRAKVIVKRLRLEVFLSGAGAVLGKIAASDEHMKTLPNERMEKKTVNFMNTPRSKCMFEESS